MKTPVTQAPFGYFAIGDSSVNLVSNVLRRKTVTGAGPKKQEKTKEETS
jgi:hypothetical protein